MKKKLLIFALMLTMLVCLLAISVSAETITYENEEIELVNNLGDPSWYTGTVAEKITDKDSIVILKDADGNKKAFPSYYIFRFVVSNDTVYINYADDAKNPGVDYSFVNANQETQYSSGSIYYAEIPSGVTKAIQNYIFGRENGIAYETNCVEIVLPDSITEMSAQCFRKMPVCKKITLPKNVKTIASWAFSGSTALTEVVVPEGCLLETTGNSFSGCTSLTIFNFANLSKLTSIGGSAFESCALIGKVDLSNCADLVTIGNKAFKSCKSITSVDISNATELETIDFEAFYVCSAITEIKFANTPNLATIGYSAFSGTTSLEKIYIDLSSVTTIGYSAFMFTGKNDAGNTKTVWYTPDGERLVNLYSLTTLPQSAFASSNLGGGASDPTKIIWPKEIKVMECSSDGQQFRKCNIVGTMILNFSTEALAENTTRGISNWSLRGNSFDTLIITGDCVTIKGSALSDVSTLTKIVILDSSIDVTGADVFNKTVDLYCYANAFTTNTTINKTNVINITAHDYAYYGACGADCKVTLASDSTVATIATPVHTDEGVVDSLYCPIGAVVNYTCKYCKRVRTEGEGTEHSHTVAVIVYNDGFTSAGLKTLKCAGQGCTSTLEEGEPTLPIFVINGYTKSETGSLAQSFAINREAFEEYINAGNDLTYGLVAAVKHEKLGTLDGKLFTSKGNKINEKVATVDFTNRPYDIMELVIAGLTEANADVEVYCCAYYTVGDNVYYMGQEGVGDTASAVTIATAPTVQDAVLPTKED
ncbi:MAG: leucine-rich repeat domain-containing protein [Clostridia bacterium]|nr:leucine-rich repeat domain-containing protein [Clostridia bacterium]MBQ7907844.1 leucine-rich repeat domain-containing protein [Clostridia bacterium]